MHVGGSRQLWSAKGYISLGVSFLADLGLLSFVYPVSFDFSLMRELIVLAFFLINWNFFVWLFHAAFFLSLSMM